MNRLLAALSGAAVLGLTACAPNVIFAGPAFQDLGTTQESYTVNVGLFGGFLAGAEWRATASHPWIRVSPAVGGGPATVTISVDRAALDPDSQLNSGTVTFTSPSGASFTTRLLLRFAHADASSLRGRLFPGGTVQTASTAPKGAAGAASLQALPLAALAPGPEWVEGEVLATPAVSDLAAFARALGASDREVSPAGFVRLPTRPGENVPAAVRRLLARPDVAHAQPNFIYRALGPATGSTNDPYFGHQWNLWSTRVSCQGAAACTDAAWLIEGGQAAVRVAVLDTGIIAGHQEWNGLGANPIVDGHDFVDGDSNPDASHCADPAGYHGQQVAGVVGAASDNALGIAGAARAVTIVPVRVLGCAGSGTTTTVADGIRYAAGLPNASGLLIPRAHVLNLSVGGSSHDPVLEAAVNAAHAAGSVLVAAAGNYRTEPVLVPARYANTVAVGSVDLNHAGNLFSRSSFSSYGPELDLVAPGGQQFGTQGEICRRGTIQETTRILAPQTAPSEYVCFQGTSAATPLVSAAAALAIAADPGLGPGGVKSLLRSRTQNLDRSPAVDCPVDDNQIGCGVLDAFAVLSTLVGPSAVEVFLEDESGRLVAAPVRASAWGIFEFTGLPSPGPYRVIARRVSGAGEVGRYFRPDRVVLVPAGQSGVNFGIDGSLF